MATGFPQPTNFANGDVLQAASVNDITGTLNSLGNIIENAQTGTAYTLVIGDATKLISMNNAAGNTLTIPPNSSVAFATGTQLVVYQKGAGQTTIAAGAGVTINSEGSKLKLKGQYAVATLIKLATDTWVAAGNLSA